MLLLCNEWILLGSADSAEQQALTYAALGLALGPGEHPAAKIVVGFPVEVMRDEAKAKDVVKALMGWMIGTHRFQINDKDYGITIDKVIVIAQPLGWVLLLGDQQRRKV